MIALPPTKSEQEAIAGALSDADGLIESLGKLTAKKRDIKQGAMQELLTGKCVAFVDNLEAYAGGDVVILRPAEGDSLFMGYYLNTPAINAQKASLGQGDAVVYISAMALAGIQIRVPGHPEQTAVAAILSDMDAEIAAL